jgi:hypothetical protein
MQPAPPPYTINEPRADDSNGTRRLVGLVLLGIGAIVALMVLERVFRILSEGGEFPLIERLVGARGPVTTPDGDWALPDGAFVLAGYGVVVALLGIASGIAQAFLKSGAQLLHLDVRTVLRALREHRDDAGSPAPPGTGRP